MGGRTDLRPCTAKPQEGFAKEGRTKKSVWTPSLLALWVMNLPNSSLISMNTFFGMGGGKNSGFVQGTGAALYVLQVISSTVWNNSLSRRC